MRHLPFVTATVLWTLFVWGNRLNNIGRSDDGFSAGNAGSAALSVAMVAFALVVGVLALRGHRWLGTAIARFALATAVVWLFRVTDILAGDWSVAFTVVHALLAVVSVGLAYAAVREVRRRPFGGVPDVEPASADSGTPGSAG